MNQDNIRVRFAPSPTGPLHIGGVRTALYNYLFAKKHGGDMLLRIEDTDQTRYVEGAENYIIESLQWCGIHFNEGVGVGGPFVPYRQSERKAIYKQYALDLIDKGYAYYAFDTPQELDAARKSYEAEKKNFQYDQHNRLEFKNSLTLTEAEVTAIIESDEPYVIRIMIPENEEILVTDLIRGEVRVNSTQLDDKVIFKSDGLPTYHLANVVDDYLMKISHVIRGEEWLPSAPLHVLLYRYLGWEHDMPHFAHLPLLLKPDGNGKLSKRDGDRMGFPVFPLQWTDPQTKEISSGYRESGYLPDACINMLAFLGWNPGTEQEIFSMDELIEAFSLERVGKAGSKFDPEKAKWFNHHYLQQMSDATLAELLAPELTLKVLHLDTAKLLTVIGMVKPRMTFLHEFWEQASFFFVAPDSYDSKSVKDRWRPDSAENMKKVGSLLQETEPFHAAVAKHNVMNFITEAQLNTGQVMNALRLLIVGASKGPDLFEIMELIGKEQSLNRIEKGIAALSQA
ncbi:MAG: glutamate--tRNA ligase [Bacillota bacterium]